MKTRKILKMTKALGTLIGLLTVVGCDAPASVPTEAQSVSALTAEPLIETPQTVAVPTPTSTPVAFQLTYKTLTQTRNPVNGWTGSAYRVTVTGSCAQYQGLTYCWDDGIKTMTFTYMHVLLGGTYSFFNLTPYSGGVGPAAGQVTTDLAATPVLITANLDSVFDARAQDAPTEVPDYVLSHGTDHTVTCTEDAGILNCSDFTIDLNQLHL